MRNKLLGIVHYACYFDIDGRFENGISSVSKTVTLKEDIGHALLNSGC